MELNRTNLLRLVGLLPCVSLLTIPFQLQPIQHSCLMMVSIVWYLASFITASMLERKSS